MSLAAIVISAFGVYIITALVIILIPLFEQDEAEETVSEEESHQDYGTTRPEKSGVEVDPREA